MRRAVIVALASALVAACAAAFVSGLLAARFLQAADDGAGAAEWLETGGLSQLLLAGVGIMFVALLFASNAARIVLMGRGVRNPGRTLRGPLVVAVVGAVAGTVVTIPGVLLLVLVGVVWGMVRVYDELRPAGASRLAALAEALEMEPLPASTAHAKAVPAGVSDHS